MNIYYAGEFNEDIAHLHRRSAHRVLGCETMRIRPRHRSRRNPQVMIATASASNVAIIKSKFHFIKMEFPIAPSTELQGKFPTIVGVAHVSVSRMCKVLNDRLAPTSSQ